MKMETIPSVEKGYSSKLKHNQNEPRSFPELFE